MPPSEPIRLREVLDSDLPVFYEQQRDPAANELAGFPPRDLEPFMAHWAKIRTDQTNLMRTILFGEQVAGNIVSFVMDGHQEVGYWLGREFWGRGLATRALEMFVAEVKIRLLYGYVIKDNLASQRVLQKCGFQPAGSVTEFSAARNAEVEFLIFKLE
jgi:RimJ/RimL family protein N-acetyltransferase